MLQGTRGRLFAISLVVIAPAVVLARSGGPLVVPLLLVMAASAIIAHWGARQTMRSARILADVANRMAKGELGDRGDRLTGDEDFVPVGKSLHQLAERMSGTLETLKVERDLMGGILDGMQEGVLLLDRAGRIAVVNPALRDMLLIGADAVGRAPMEVIRNSELKQLLDKARTSGQSSGEIELVGIKPRRLLVRGIAMGGEPGGLLVVFVDVTEIRRLETLRRDFVANVSHELRTPVTAIRSAAETIRGAAARDPEAAVRFLDIIERNAERLHHLVEDLLELSRIESREFRLAFEGIDLGVFAPYVVSLFRERAEKKRVRLHCSVPDSLPNVEVDKRALEQVISNLIDNAVKYCPAGAEVSIVAEADPSGVRIFVRDTGPGIEERHLPRIFERFYRVDSGRSREVGGTGLGLSIVKHLVEALGGTVRVESTLGKGTTFTFTLRPWKGAPSSTRHLDVFAERSSRSVEAAAAASAVPPLGRTA